MRLSPGSDKKLESNLRILTLCSRFKTIKLKTLQDQCMADQNDFLDRKENFEYRLFLENAYIQKCEDDNMPYALPIDNSQLSGFILPAYTAIPREFIQQNKAHQSNARKINSYAKQGKEQEELRQIILGDEEDTQSPRKVDYRKLQDFLDDKSHTIGFRRFATRMQKSNPYMTLLQYKAAASQIARENDIDKDGFLDRLNQTFSIHDVRLGLNQEIKGRFIPLGAKVSAIALVGMLSLNGLSSMIHTAPEPIQGHEETRSAYTQGTTLEHPDEDSTTVVLVDPSNAGKNTTPPISNSIKINSYNTAARDFMQKAEEIYAYNTGETINLSDLKYENIGQANSKVYVATIGNKTLSFSAMSEFSTNSQNLEKALEAAGATVSSYNTTITYLTRDGKSIAICDGKGNPIRSGKVLEKSYSGGTEMYNQNYVNSAKNLMRDNGIDPTGKSDAELVGYFLFNAPPAQNDELSKAIGPLSSLASYMKTTFPYSHSGNEDQFAISQYAAKSKKLGEDFNAKVTGNTEKADDLSR